MSIKYYQSLINNYIDKYLLEIENTNLREIVKYSLEGGKRLRSMIVLDISKELCDEYLYDMALSVELLHAASLILDDLPCMDNDLTRRNKPCLHIKFGEFQAKMAAHFLFFESYRLITNYDNEVLGCLFKEICCQNKLACYGQYFDLFNETLLHKRINIDTINLKTSPFFIIAFLGGYLLGNGDVKNINLIKKIGIVFSNFFQIYDDFDDYEKDMKKDNNINQVVLLGREKAYSLFIENKDKFLEYLDIINLKTKLMEEIVEYLISKVVL